MHDRVTRVLLAIMVAGGALVGFWAALAPRSFFDDFPGGGRHWVLVDGPFNEHLVRDVGTLNLALMALALAALVRPGRYLVQVAAGATLVNSLPHLLYHAAHLSPFDGSDKVALMVSLSVSVVVPIVLLVRSMRVTEGDRAQATATV